MTTSQGRESRGGNRPPARRFSGRRRRQCVCKEVGTITYRDVSVLRRFISDRGRIESGRKAGNCAKCQRQLGKAIARARFLALLPYAPNHLRVTGSISSPTSAEADDEADTEDDELIDDIDDESEEDLDAVDSFEDDDSEDEDRS
ncbi:MAG: 30S ribosomal protein S18 [Chloroflexi bacterium]|nr:30S ribosomal protein S18 [Chloroflexota bacterium]